MKRKQLVMAIGAGVVIAAAATSYVLTIPKHGSPYSKQATVAALVAATDVVVSPDVDYIAEAAPASFRTTLGPVEAIVSFWPSTSAAQEAARAYQVWLAGGEQGQVDVRRNTVIAWTPSPAQETRQLVLDALR